MTQKENKTKIKFYQNERVITNNDPKKYCRFRKFNIKYIDYKEVEFLSKFLNPQGKILPRKNTGTSSKYQKKISAAIKRARQVALLPYVVDNFK